jgi:multisubunit Na+/H+ antiporter MnhG subunit
LRLRRVIESRWRVATGPASLAFIPASGMGAAMDVLLRPDWWSRMQAAAACVALGLIGAIVFGAF